VGVFRNAIGDRQALADVYANADAFLHPNAHEPFGIAPLEAMASGLPLVAPNRGGVRAYADDSNAWLADPTPHALAGAVEAAIGDPALRVQRAVRARATAEEHRWSAVTSSFFQLYDEIVEHAVWGGESAAVDRGARRNRESAAGGGGKETGRGPSLGSTTIVGANAPKELT
jgi:glycogen synthase